MPFEPKWFKLFVNVNPHESHFDHLKSHGPTQEIPRPRPGAVGLVSFVRRHAIIDKNMFRIRRWANSFGGKHRHPKHIRWNPNGC